MEKKPSWDDIPSLKLETDLDAADTASSEKRAYPRLSTREIQKMLLEQVEAIYINVVTEKGAVSQKGILEDINQTGMRFVMPQNTLHRGEVIRIGTILGTHPIKTKATIQWKTNDQIGVKFYNPRQEDVAFLSGLYTSKVFNKV